MGRATSISIFLLISLGHLAVNAQSPKDLSSPKPLPAGSTLVIGFLGGWDHWDDANRGVRQLALKLRHTPGVYAESIENHRWGVSLRFIERALDTNGNHKLDDSERRNARVILFGQSLGGRATLRLARALKKRHIPVLLTVQIDSVGADDKIVPDNVRAAANLFQHELFTFQGRTKIQAANPRATALLENTQFHYPAFNANGPQPKGWARKTFGGGHARMEADPAVWAHVESLILQAINTH